MSKSTKPKSATSFKETAFGILPRSKIIQLEAEGIRKAQQYILKVSTQKISITPQLILDLQLKTKNYSWQSLSRFLLGFNIVLSGFTHLMTIMAESLVC